MGALLDTLDTALPAGPRGLRRVVTAQLAEASRLVSERGGSSYASDAWGFVRDCVWTRDQADQRRPVKRFPTYACVRCREYLIADYAEACPRCQEPPKPLRYLEEITRAWVAATPSVLMIPKPRRMKLSWLMVILHAHLAATQPGVAIYFISSKQEKSGELVDRAEFVLKSVPSDRMLIPTMVRKTQPPKLVFPETGSFIEGIGEGPDQLRQYAATRILADEIGTWTWPRASYAAMKPCIEGGGAITLVSSAYPGFWKNAVSGELSL